MKVTRPEISYRDFLKLKNEYLRDLDPLRKFGELFCEVFVVDNERIKLSKSVAEAYSVIDSVVDWVI